MGQAARAMVEYLRHAQPDQLITYIELSEIAGFDVQASRNALLSARKYVRDVYRLVFDVCVNVGLIRVEENEKSTLASKRRRYARRWTENTVRLLQTTDMAALTPTERHQWMGEMSVAAAVVLGTLDVVVRTIETQKSPQPLLIDPRSYGDVFKGL
jgi:hypothetical protein